MGPAVIQQAIGIERVSALRDDEEDRDLAQMLMGHADDGAVADALEKAGDLLDLGRRDVLAAADDQLLEAARDGQEAVLVAPREVARAIPAVPQGGSGFLRLVVIAGHQVGTADDQLAFLAGRDIPAARRIDDAHREAGDRYAAGTEDAPAGR